ncbi:hypothetical protein [Bounagaea algeriensis]
MRADDRGRSGAREAPTGWREQQQELRHWLRRAPGCSSTPGDHLGSEAVLTGRENTDR